MNTQTTPQSSSHQHTQSQGFGSAIPFEAINEPGAYLANWSGHLIRIPEDGVAPGRSPLISFVGQQALIVTKISENPWVTLTKARVLASNLDLDVNF